MSIFESSSVIGVKNQEAGENLSQIFLKMAKITFLSYRRETEQKNVNFESSYVIGAGGNFSQIG